MAPVGSEELAKQANEAGDTPEAEGTVHADPRELPRAGKGAPEKPKQEAGAKGLPGSGPRTQGPRTHALLVSRWTGSPDARAAAAGSPARLARGGWFFHQTFSVSFPAKRNGKMEWTGCLELCVCRGWGGLEVRVPRPPGAAWTPGGRDRSSRGSHGTSRRHRAGGGAQGPGDWEAGAPEGGDCLKPAGTQPPPECLCHCSARSTTAP